MNSCAQWQAKIQSFYQTLALIVSPPSSCQKKKLIAAAIKTIIEEEITNRGQKVLGWRHVPVDSSDLGYSVKPSEPYHAQVFIGKSDGPGLR